MVIRKYRNLVALASVFYLIAFFFLPGASAGLPQESAQELSRQAYAILRQNCFGCHGAGKMSGLDLRTAESALAGGDNGKVIEPFDAGASRLYQFITHQAKPTMPPGKKIPDDAIETLRRWIEAGASFDGFEKEVARKDDEPAKIVERPITPEERGFWAFQPPRRLPEPRVSHPGWGANPIDAFLLAKMKAKGLKPSPRADRRTLIRRAYLDLTGLPPSPDEVEAFVKDSSPGAWVGKLGEPPTHPELLDWLAMEFMSGGAGERESGRVGDRETRRQGDGGNPQSAIRNPQSNGWSLKRMHRLMMTSQAYQMASDDIAADVAIDPENRLLWRMPRARLEAEIIRDQILAVAGNLDRTLGGPCVYPHIDPKLFQSSTKRTWPGKPDDDPSTWRRSLYVYSKRSIRYPLFEAFDQPNLINSCDRRNSSTIAPQALLLMNNNFVLTEAKYFAERLRREAGDDARAQAQKAYRLALGRAPTAFELAKTAEFIRSGPDGLAEFCHALFNLNEFVYRQ